MAKHHYYHDPVLTKPLPSTKVPTLVILGLIGCLVLGKMYFFGDPKELLGGPPPKNEYQHYLQPQKPKLKIRELPPVTTPTNPVPTQSVAPVTPTTSTPAARETN